jgi:DNA-binding NarL/FixJ family response regulator
VNERLPRVAVLADDLIWASRLVAAVEKSGAHAAGARSADDLRAILAAAPEEAVVGVVIDLNGRRYDGVAQVQTAAAAGRRVIAVGQHEDLELRRRALAAGAERVYSYNKLFRDGPQVIGRLLGAQAVQAVAEDEQ